MERSCWYHRRPDVPVNHTPSKLGTSLSDRAVAEIVKQRVKDAGLEYNDFSGHSLVEIRTSDGCRSGWRHERVIAKQTGVINHCQCSEDVSVQDRYLMRMRGEGGVVVT